jgi:uncharacterized Zn-binding protein involved in type VI secretion
MLGKIANGCPLVLVTGKRAARKSDVTDHAALIGEGEPTVVIAGLPAARLGDRFVCPKYTEEPHVGGRIATGTGRVVIGGEPAARQGDTTVCHGEGADISGLDADTGGGASLDDAAAENCRRLWQKYDQEARDLIAPAGDDHRRRNHIINGAYADLYAGNKKFVWAGLGAYASKQVGCAMDHSQRLADQGIPGRSDVAAYMLESLGNGNRSLFLDVYPLHRFYEEHGWARMAACAGERRPPVPAAALDGFAALDRYEKSGDDAHLEEHLRSIAYHEQVNILQRDVYNDAALRKILDLNEGNVDDVSGKSLVPDPPRCLMELGGAKPADVVMTSECVDATPNESKTIPFKRGREGNLYDVDQRMDWIMNDIGGYYVPHSGSPGHMADIERLRQRGARAGGDYP